MTSNGAVRYRLVRRYGLRLFKIYLAFKNAPLEQPPIPGFDSRQLHLISQIATTKENDEKETETKS